MRTRLQLLAWPLIAVLACSPALAQNRSNRGTPGAATSTSDPAKPSGDRGTDRTAGAGDPGTSRGDGASAGGTDGDRRAKDCPDEKAKPGTAEKAKPGSAAPVDPACADKVDRYGRVVVLLPDILVDLFPPAPAPRGDTVAVGGRPSGPADASPGGDGATADTAARVDPAGVTLPASRPAAPTAASRVTVPAQAVSGAFVADEVLVTIDGGAADAAEIAARFGLAVRSQRRSQLLGVTVARLGIPDGRPVGTVLAQLAADPRALARVPNHVLVLQQAGAVVNYAFQRISLDSDTASGADVGIAVIDTAIDAEHPALASVVAEQYDAMSDIDPKDRDHGTSVDGLIAGVGPFRGVAPGSSIYHARAFEGGQSTMDIILDALDWAAGKEVRVINMSFVGPDNGLLEAACASARARGMVLVAAAGNNGPGAPYAYPGAYPGVIAVTATDANDQLMERANRGPYVYVSAPGVDMLAPVAGGTDAVTGTSFAAAIVSGAVANLIHDNPERSADWIEKALAETASDLGPTGRDDDFGFGLVNAAAASAFK